MSPLFFVGKATVVFSEKFYKVILEAFRFRECLFQHVAGAGEKVFAKLSKLFFEFFVADIFEIFKLRSFELRLYLPAFYGARFKIRKIFSYIFVWRAQKKFVIKHPAQVIVGFKCGFPTRSAFACTDGFQRGAEKIHIMSCKLACNAVYGFSPERKMKFCVFGRILYRFFSVYAAGVKIVKLYCYGCEGIVG